MADNWLLALIVDDRDAIKVAAAYYALPRNHRRNLEKLADVSGVTQEIRPILTRLDAAGMLRDRPPEILVDLINEYVLKHLPK